jgi:hypothetical protein
MLIISCICLVLFFDAQTHAKPRYCLTLAFKQECSWARSSCKRVALLRKTKAFF